MISVFILILVDFLITVKPPNGGHLRGRGGGGEVPAIQRCPLYVGIW